jgi:hypothetical protein
VRRLVPMLALVAALALVVLPGASALDIEQDLQPYTGVVGVPYSYQLTGEEGCADEYRFRLTNGELPPGLVLQLNGVIVGTPLAAGTWDFYVELTDDCEPAFPNSLPSQGKFRIRIQPQVAITTTSLAPTRVGLPYTTRLLSTGAETQWWSVASGTLPPGLTLKEDGTLTGTPNSIGSFTFTAKLLSPGPDRIATKELTLVVAAPVAASAPAAKPAEVGVPFTTTPTTTGGAAPFAWSVTAGSLPAGLTLNTATGAISGTPAAAGSFTVTLSVSEATASSATVPLALTVAPRLAIATTALSRAAVGHVYRVRLRTSGGIGAVTWRVKGALPRGIRFDAKTGTLAGTAQLRRTARITVTATDSLGAKATRTLVLQVR